MKATKRYPMNGPTMREQATMAYWWISPNESVSLRKKYAR